MLETKCYTHLPHLPRVSRATADRCTTAVYNAPTKLDLLNKKVNTFTYDPGLNETKFVNDLRQEFGLTEAMCMSFPPKTIYDWHTDFFVRVRINYVLNDVGHAYTLFREQSGSNDIIYNIDECKYTAGFATLFNSRVQHCVINNSDQTRYLLSFRIFDNNISYEQVEKFLINYNSDEIL